MGSISAAQSELGREVRLEHLHLIDVGLELRVDGALGSLAGSGCVGRGSLLGAGLVGLAGEEGVVDLADVDAVKGDRGRGGDHILLVHATEGDTVAGIRA